MSWRTVVTLLVACWVALPTQAQDLPRGVVVDSVACIGDSTQTYALYLPSTYAPSKPWKVLMGFHPSARGKAIVETYRDAAEAHGYIVAASNTSRNGSWELSGKAASAMSADLARRFTLDDRRIYLTGMSGGARVALWVALATKAVAGVIASSAGYPDSRPRSSLPFVVFATAGTEDFNNSEMRQLDRALKTPHRLAVFDGGHTLPPVPVATAAIEWLELQAMASKLAPADDAFIARVFEQRRQVVTEAGESARGVRLLREMAADFKAFRDVSALTSQADALAGRKDIKSAMDRERDDEEAEQRMLEQVFALEQGLASNEATVERLVQIRQLLGRISKEANADVDSTVRARARRVLSTITAGASTRVQDPQYLKLLQEYRLAGRAPRG